MALSPGKRLIRCLTGEPVDRVPFGVFGVCWGPWGSTLERWTRESGDPKLDYWRAIGAEQGCAGVPLHYGLWPHFPREVVAEIDAEVEKARWMLANGGRYIPGFDHLIPPNVPWENMLYAARALRALCHGEE